MVKTFIRVVERWIPTPDQTLLEFGGGLFGDATGFAAISRDMRFGRGEGLPGQAWVQGRPILLKHFAGSHFRRVVAAEAAGLTGGLAVPVFAGSELKAVIVLYVGDDVSLAGAIELWQNDPRISGDMTLAEGYYGAGAQAFEALSRDTFLPRGAGLPGMAWQRDEAVFMEDLSAAGRFLRSGDAAQAGMARGLAVPCSTPSMRTCVAAFLSAPESPIARRIEGWAPDAVQGRIQRTFGFCEQAGSLPPGATLPAGAVGDCIGEAMATGVPGMVQAPSSLLAWPVFNDEGQVVQVVALYF